MSNFGRFAIIKCTPTQQTFEFSHFERSLQCTKWIINAINVCMRLHPRVLPPASNNNFEDHKFRLRFEFQSFIFCFMFGFCLVLYKFVHRPIAINYYQNMECCATLLLILLVNSSQSICLILCSFKLSTYF